ncbi:MAG: hypothetical protein AAGC73_02745 [Verrucomicrobiota bacterium]
MDALPISLIRHLADFGMLVILWLVQLVIYPSFLRISADQLVLWHRSYTTRVGFVIIPTMFTQLFCQLWAATTSGGTLNYLSLTTVLVCWILTFFVSVPLHNKISNGEGEPATLNRLIQTNWPRTVLWTLAFILGIAAA